MIRYYVSLKSVPSGKEPFKDDLDRTIYATIQDASEACENGDEIARYEAAPLKNEVEEWLKKKTAKK